MSVIARKRAKSTVYYVVFAWQGKRVWERSGTDKRAAVALEAKRLREVRDGVYLPEGGTTTATTVAQYLATWAAQRTTRSASDDLQRINDHVLTRTWFATMRMVDVEPRHILRLVQELQTGTTISIKTGANTYGAVRTAFRFATFSRVIPSDPCVLPKGSVKKRRTARKPYAREDVVRLLACPTLTANERVLAAIAFYAGAREGEICGLRWGDWTRVGEPLGALLIERQYDDRPLKSDSNEGDRPRIVPVHPALASVLAWWHDEGFELVHLRPPTAQDHILTPAKTKSDRHALGRNLTRSAAYKAWVRACKKANVENLSLHSTRHTMITWARRGGARESVLERITHNATGSIVDHYTHWDWEPLCEAMLCLRYGVDVQRNLHRNGETPGNSAGADVQRTAQSSGESCEVAPLISGSIPGASTTKALVSKGEQKTRQQPRQHRPTPVRRMLRECVTIAASGEIDAEVRMLVRLRRIAKMLPATSTPSGGPCAAR